MKDTFSDTHMLLRENVTVVQHATEQFEQAQQQMTQIMYISEENAASTEEMMSMLVSENELIRSITYSTEQLHNLSTELRNVSSPL